MADYDVGAVALVVPAKSSPRSTYRPAVSVRNNGVHEAYASGYLRIYAAGLLVFETELYSATIPAGATGTAQAVDYWTPETEGFYIIHAYLSCPLDQVEPNNMLQPVTIEITGAEPPTPPTVPAHAAQHEEGAIDEISIDGLKGRAADPQDALAHAAAHQAGGSDALNVGSLQGVLAQDQPAKVHSNTRHDPVMATEAELVAHQGSVAVHTTATNLANRATTGPLTGIVPSSQIQMGTAAPEPGDDPDAMGLRFDRDMGYVNPVHHAYKHQADGTDPISFPALWTNASPFSFDYSEPETELIRLWTPAAWVYGSCSFHFNLYGLATLVAQPGGILRLRLYYHDHILQTLDVDVSLARTEFFHLFADIIGTTAPSLVAGIHYLADTIGLPTGTNRIINSVSPYAYPQNPQEDGPLILTAQLINCVLGTTLAISMGTVNAVTPTIPIAP
jgi:hypothetical protein